MKKIQAVLNILRKTPNVPFTPNEITILLKEKNKNLKIHHSEVLRILLEEYVKNPKIIGYKKIARVHLFWFKKCKKGKKK